MKTTLDGTEKAIDVLGSYVSVKNNSAAVIYASNTAGIDPTNDNVTPIQPGESFVVPWCNKKVYVLGAGDIAVESSNQAFNFFKPAPKLGGNSGDDILPTAETMPYMDGIIGYYTPENIDITNNFWRNKFEISQDIQLINAEKNGNALRFLSNGYGMVKYSGTLNVIYIISMSSNISKLEKQIALVGKNLKTMQNGYGFNIMINSSSPHIYTLTSISFDAPSEISADSAYHCVCAARDSRASTASIYVDAEFKKSISQANDSPLYSSDSLCINNWKNTSSTLWNGTSSAVTDCLFIAFGVLSHTDDQIKANSEWLLNKYLIGTTP